MTITDGERLFSLLLIGMIRQCNVSAQWEGDVCCDLARGIIPERVVPEATRLSAAMRVTDINECERKLHEMLEQLLPPLDAIARMSVSLALLPFCILLISDRQSIVRDFFPAEKESREAVKAMKEDLDDGASQLLSKKLQAYRDFFPGEKENWEAVNASHVPHFLSAVRSQGGNY